MIEAILERCAGIDVGKKFVVVCVMTGGARDEPHTQIKKFGTIVSELQRLSEWLVAEGCTHAVMESTGSYWKPVFNLLEAHVRVILANAADVQNRRGHKTDPNGISFRKGRDLAAWLGLVPRQHSTGGKTRLLGISKLGNEYLRRMMLHGARSVVMQMERKPSALGEWLTNLSARRHRNVTVVALANKMARIAWAILSKGTHYSAPAFAAA